ncbi:MAG: hypothetical protein GY697_24750, partial [Desulfobacterales bacterium]|nr:hypothetical protein [Desulfobacterales bacterium]
MRTIISPISLEEKSLSVALLHKTLKVFGLPVAEQEVKRKKVGEDTKTKVRELQKQLNVPADETTLVNELMISAMGEALRARGLMATSRSFTVSGVVRLLDLSVKKQQQLLAFDLDLGGVSIYRKVKTITQIEKSGGFELLGEAISDNRGKYSITFYDWQYQRAERKKADVVVYAIEKVKDEFKIVGRSSLVNSDDYSDKGLVHGVDVVISQADARTEYEKVMSPLSAFLKENKSDLSRIAASSEQLAFVVNELDIEPTRLNIMAVAQLLIKEQEKELSHELLYGI